MISGAVLVEELAALGVAHVVLCPGSRSAPLAYAAASAAAAGELALWVRVDERSAGFFALGLAKASGVPAAVVTTSGTAAANLGPALLEARHAHVPLIALTADRPATLVGTGANQTADQVVLFPGVAKAVVRVASADGQPAAWRFAARRAYVAAGGYLDRTPGPVHVNVELTPPLVGDPGPLPPRTPFSCHPEPTATCHPERSEGSIPGGEILRCAQDDKGRDAQDDKEPPRTVVVAGDMPVSEGQRWARAAAAAHVPLIAEPSSNARHGAAALCHGVELLDRFAPEIEHVVVVGHPTLHRPVAALLARTDLAITAVTPTADWVDPGWAVTAVVTDLELAPGDPAWLERWQTEDRVIAALRQPTPGEAVAAAVLAALGPDDNLVLGSSQLIRDAAAAPLSPDPPRVYANRGLAGIDGTIATALGVAAATGRPTTALIGDLTALHDLTSLVIPELERDIDLRLVVADDNGGAIFATLEYAAFRPDDLARLFTVPHGIDLAAAASALGADATNVTVDDLSAELARPWSGRRVLVVDLT
jgi:2-succinyl-5-enolpyruvyl-6-hydroxy-3-cyclohexene-1-carboxylate synthase